MKQEEELLVDLYTAYFDARRNKRNTINQLRFELNFESHLMQLYSDITNRNYAISPSICFIVDHPVKREIFAADFRDRVIHHLIYNYLNPFYEEAFINDSYSCRKNKGTHYGVQQVDYFIKACSNFYTQDCYILKLDIEGYFMNIDRELLLAKIRRFVEEIDSQRLRVDKQLLLYLIECVLNDDPTEQCIVKGSKQDWEGLPLSKSLFHTPRNRGLPIGNLTSQLFSNVFLHEMDTYIKDTLKIAYYGRYVDDFVLVHPDKEYLKEVKNRLSDFLKERLFLDIHPRKVYLQHYSKGVVFLGAMIKPHRIYISNRTKHHFIQCIRKWNHYLTKQVPSLTDLHSMRSSINSYLGIMQHYRSYNIRKKYLWNKQKPLLIYKYGYLLVNPYKTMKYILKTIPA